MVRVALTSIPPRFATLGARLEELLAQCPEGLTLTLPRRYERFPGWSGKVPALPAGVELLRTPDLGPATKFAAVFARYTEADVLLADDDCVYAPDWLPAFSAARATHPGAAIAASTFDTVRLGLAPGHRIAQGFAGILLRPAWLGPEVTRPDSRARWVDDIWLSAHIAAAGLPLRPCPEAREFVTPLDGPGALQDAVIDDADRAALNRRVASDLSARLRIWTDAM